MNEADNNFLYLNADNRWPGFHWEGLELREDGALQLLSLPLLEGELPEEIASLPAPDGPAGVAVDEFGTVYFSDPAGHRVLRIIPGTEGTLVPLTFIDEEEQPVHLNTPRGLWLSPQRLLFVADSGNHRILVFDTAYLQLVGTLGQIDETPEPSPEPGHFDTPWVVTGDSAGNVYVVDHGNARVQKFDAAGPVIQEFWDTMQEEDILSQPADIAVSESGTLYVLDATAQTIFVFDTDGNAERDDQDQPIAISLEDLQQPMGLAIADEKLYLGDNGLRRVLTFKRQEQGFVLAGEAVGYAGPVAGIALDSQGDLLVHAGAALAPAPLAHDKSYRTEGILWSEAISAGNAAVSWHRLRAQTAVLAPQVHLQIWLHTSDDETQPPPVDPGSAQPFPQPWRSSPLDVTETFIAGQPARFVWIGVQFLGNSLATPALSQMRIDFDHPTYLRYLPPVYGEEAESREFLSRFLSLFESLSGETEAKIAGLSAWFDPLAVPKEVLSWLAGWLALPLREELIRRHGETEADYEARKAQLNLQFFRTAISLYPQRGILPAIDAMLRAWLHGELLETEIILTDWKPLHSHATSFFQLAPENEEDEVPDEIYAQIGLTTVLGVGPPFFFLVDLVPNPRIRELRHPAGLEVFERAARQLLDSEKPAHTFYQLHLSAEALTMRLAPEHYAGWRPGEIYAQIGETTLLWDEE
jgi:phage tail-like protein